MTLVFPRKQYGQSTCLAGLLACSPHPPSRRMTVVKDRVRYFMNLQQRDCAGFSPASLLIRFSNGECLRNKTWQR